MITEGEIMIKERRKTFRWLCGARFEARLTPGGRGVQYRHLARGPENWQDEWQSVGTTAQAIRYANGEDAYGLWHRHKPELPAYALCPLGLHRSDGEHAVLRKCVRRVLEHLGVLPKRKQQLQSQ